MNIFILNKSFGKFRSNKENIFYYLKVKEDFKELKRTIIEEKPKNIISIDFGIPTSENTDNNLIIIGKEAVLINSTPVNWGIPRADKWLEASNHLNMNICKLLEANCMAHMVGSAIQLEHSENIKKRENALKWIYKNIKVNFLDNNSATLLEIISDLNLNDNYAFIRLIHKNSPINKNRKFYKKITNYIYSMFFYKIISKKILFKIKQKNLILKLSKLN